MASIKLEFDRFDDFLKRAGRQATNTGPFWEGVGELVVSSVQSNFEQQGRPRRWKRLAPSTLRRRRGRASSAKILQDTGALKNSVSARSDRRGVSVGTNLVYAATHQFGRDSIPARPYLVVQDQDLDDIAGLAVRHLFG